MSLYFVNKSTQEGTLNEHLIVAHKAYPLIASVWSSPTAVLLSDNEGETLMVIREPATGATATNKTLTVTALAWHPTKRVLAIGWSNGKLSLWRMPDASDIGIEDKDATTAAGTFASSASQSVAAKAAIMTDVEGSVREHNAGAAIIVEWTTRGDYLVSCSRQKTVTVWVLELSATGGSGTGADKAAGAKVTVALKPLWTVESAQPIVQVIHVPSNQPQMRMQRAAVDESANGAASPVADDANAHDDSAVDDDELTFLLADGSPTVYSLTDEQRIVACATHKEEVVALLYDPSDRLMVTLSTTHMIEAFKIGEALGSTSVLRRKLSTPTVSAASGKFLLSMVWAGPGVVAFGCGDDRVRVFDIYNEVMYMVPFPQEGMHITYVMTEAHHSMLAVGTAEGVVAVFASNTGMSGSGSSKGAGAAVTNRRTSVTGGGVGASGVAGLSSSSAASPAEALMCAKDYAKDWEALAAHELGERVDRIVVSPMGDIAVCTGGGKHLQILHETERRRAWDGVAAATQISANLVVIESVTGCQCLLESTSKIRGLSIAFPNIALWSGTQIDIYTVNESTSTFSHVNFVPATSPAFALHRDGLLYVKDGRITFATLQMQPVAQLTFAESEGVPIVLDVMNDYLVAVSSKNFLRLARISARDLRLLGPSRPFVLHAQVENTKGGGASDNDEAEKAAKAAAPLQPLPKGPITIVSARVNAQGRRVALMTRVGTLAVADTRIWVYDADTDKVSAFDFAERNEVPGAIYWNTPEQNANAFGELEYLLLACETHQAPAARVRTAQQQQQQRDATLMMADRQPTSSPAGAGAIGNGKVATVTSREDLPEMLPDMQVFAKGDARGEDRHDALGATSILGNRAHNIVTLFATPRNGLAVHNTVSLKRYQICLVGLTIPDFLLSSLTIKGNPSNPADYVVEQKRLPDFEGLKSDKDAAVREALMKFSYYSTLGNMDEAYRCIKTIKNPSAWQGLARMCVSTGRLDVAAVALASMQDSVAARSLREAREQHPDDKNVQIAALACSLNMMDECEHYLRLSKRYDLITEVFLACGKFEQAQRHSEQFDRMHIRPIAYRYAHFMESLHNMDLAVIWYYNARCAGTEIPRIYFQTHRLAELREHMNAPAAAGDGASPTTHNANTNNSNHNSGNNSTTSAAAATTTTGAASAPGPSAPGHSSTTSRRGSGVSEDPRTFFASHFPTNKDLQLWWAKHSELRRNLPDALRFYTAIEDTYNAVRVLCSMNPPRIDKALEMVDTEVNRARAKFRQLQAADPTTAPPAPDRVGAAFFIGQHYDQNGDNEQALQYFTHAGAYYGAMRAAKQLERDNECLSLALVSGNERLMLETAAYFEGKESYDKAVELYRRVGATQCALDGCIKGNLFETLHDISISLASSDSTDPEVFLNMAGHFQSTGDYQKAVEMLVFAKRYDEALLLCQERNVTLTEDMAEAMTGVNNTLPAAEKQALLLKIAQIAKDQGSWNLAGKKYTQGGERLKAMKMLMRGGDVDKVIFFANHSRSTEIYTLAGNFLQNQSWSTDTNVHKSIIQFYTRAKAFDSLVSFYDSCAQFYIDENRNYSAALQAVEECIKTLEKAVSARGSPAKASLSRANLFKERRELLQAVVQARKLVDSITPNDEAKKKKGDEVINICSDIIKRSRPAHDDHDLIESTVRIGDIFALLVRFYFDKMDEPRNALKVLESMPKHGVEPQYFVEAELTKKVCEANGNRTADLVGGGLANSSTGTPSSTAVAAGRRRSSIATTTSEDTNTV